VYYFALYLMRTKINNKVGRPGAYIFYAQGSNIYLEDVLGRVSFVLRDVNVNEAVNLESGQGADQVLE
jgi:hypothetical protein